MSAFARSGRRRTSGPSAAKDRGDPVRAADATASGTVCIGIDVGGTFTDAVLTDRRGVWRAKAPTTRNDLGRGVLEACRLAAIRAGSSLEGVLPQVSRFGLGTTAVTNVLATRSGPPIGLITTTGFEDTIPLSKGRQVLDDGWVVNPVPIVPRNLVVGVEERLDREGQVLDPLEPEEIADAARLLVERGVDAIAVSFLWSFKNPRHEEIAVAAIHNEFPDLAVFSGAAINPVIREFERTTFALLNAYVGGAYEGIEALGDELDPPRPDRAAVAGALRWRIDHGRRGPSDPPGLGRIGTGGRRRRVGRAGGGVGARGCHHLRYGRDVLRRVGDLQRKGFAPDPR